MPPSTTRAEVLRLRMHHQQLDRPRDDARAVTDTAVLDLGVQDTGPDGAPWALAARGAPVDAGTDLPDLVMVWAARGAPHLYRRTELTGVTAALRPFSQADAARRLYDAARPLRAAGVAPGEAMATVAEALRSVVTEPMVKGVVSTRLTQELPAPYLRWCGGCQATHCYEMTFRLGALHAGLELDPGTSPPVLRPTPGWSSSTLDALRALPDVAADGPAGASDVPAHLDVVRAYLHLLGPATPTEVAGHLDAPVPDIAHRWEALAADGELVEVDVDGDRRTMLARDLEALGSPAVAPRARPVVRLVGGYDLFLQGRDRELLVPDRARQKELWTALGRPGAVVVDGEVLGTWRPRTSGRRLTVRTEPWVPWDSAAERAVDEQVQLLGRHRGATQVSRT